MLKGTVANSKFRRPSGSGRKKQHLAATVKVKNWQINRNFLSGNCAGCLTLTSFFTACYHTLHNYTAHDPGIEGKVLPIPQSR
jgi:hypothetical protein